MEPDRQMTPYSDNPVEDERIMGREALIAPVYPDLRGRDELTCGLEQMKVTG